MFGHNVVVCKQGATLFRLPGENKDSDTCAAIAPTAETLLAKLSVKLSMAKERNPT